MIKYTSEYFINNIIHNIIHINFINTINIFILLILLLLFIFLILFVINIIMLIVPVWARPTPELPDRDPLGCSRLVYLIETREPGRILRVLVEFCESWPRPKRLSRNQVKSAEASRIITVGLAGRPILPLTLKPRSVKLISY